MCYECLNVCGRELDIEESRHELGFRNEMPRQHIECKMETENQELRDNEKNRNTYQYHPGNYPEKVELLWSNRLCSMRDDRLLKQVLFGKTGGKNKRRTKSWKERPGGLVQERYLHRMVADRTKWNQLVRLCCGHQRALDSEPMEY